MRRGGFGNFPAIATHLLHSRPNIYIGINMYMRNRKRRRNRPTTTTTDTYNDSSSVTFSVRHGAAAAGPVLQRQRRQLKIYFQKKNPFMRKIMPRVVVFIIIISKFSPRKPQKIFFSLASFSLLFSYIILCAYRAHENICKNGMQWRTPFISICV